MNDKLEDKPTARYVWSRKQARRISRRRNSKENLDEQTEVELAHYRGQETWSLLREFEASGNNRAVRLLREYVRHTYRQTIFIGELEARIEGKELYPQSRFSYPQDIRSFWRLTKRRERARKRLQKLKSEREQR